MMEWLGKLKIRKEDKLQEEWEEENRNGGVWGRVQIGMGKDE